MNKIKNFLTKYKILRKIFKLSRPYKKDKLDEFPIEEMIRNRY